MTALDFQHFTPAFRTFCGDRALDSLPRELDRLNASRAVVITGPWYGNFPDVVSGIEDALGPRLAGCFDQVEDHSPIPSVEAAAAMMRKVGADAAIAVGGGSTIVTARAASILLAEQGEVRELCTSRGSGGRLVSPKLMAPKIPNWVVPSTPITAYAKAGSAVRDPETGERLALFDPKTRAQGIFLDPRVVSTAPAALVSSAGLNALSMAVESLQGGGGDPLADALLLHALRMLVEWLPKVENTPNDIDVRLQLMLAALLCGQGSDYVGGGLAQALSHAAGPVSSVSNGTVEAILLPHTTRFAAPATPGRLAVIHGALEPGASGGDAAAVTAIRDILTLLGVPVRLRDVGVEESALPEIADHAMDDWSITRTPRPATRDDVVELLSAAW
jgi:alcohol dehydrogenase class IV